MNMITCSSHRQTKKEKGRFLQFHTLGGENGGGKLASNESLVLVGSNCCATTLLVLGCLAKPYYTDPSPRSNIPSLPSPASTAFILNLPLLLRGRSAMENFISRVSNTSIAFAASCAQLKQLCTYWRDHILGMFVHA